MSIRFQKLYTTLELEDAHVIQALMRRHGVTCWLLRANGLPTENATPLIEDGYKLFIPQPQFQQALRVFQETFHCSASAPLVGPLDLRFGGKSGTVPHSELTSDSLGPEEFIWHPPTGDPVGDAWQTDQPTREESEDTELPRCERCGHEIPAGASVCLRCGEIR